MPFGREPGEWQACLALDCEQSVVLGEALRLADRANLDHVGVPAHSEVREPVVFGLPRARAGDDLPAGVAGQVARFGRLGQRSDLVDLEEKRVCGSRSDRTADSLWICAEEVVAHD